MIPRGWLFLCLLLAPLFGSCPPAALAFVVGPTTNRKPRTAVCFDSSRSSSSLWSALKVSLPKPLGLILEENDNGQGVYVKELLESGSAWPYAQQLKGASLTAVMGDASVQTLPFEAVMDKIVQVPENQAVDLEFATVATATDGDKRALRDNAYPMGTPVQITVHQYDGEDLWMYPAKVGDNLRTVLQQSGFEVYQGMREKLGNCGGAGQCTFCAMEFLDSDGWDERSDYENQKLAKYPKARLACLNNIQGPATIRKLTR